MSNDTSGNGVTAPQSPVGFKAIQMDDFYQRGSILHPITVGTIAVVILFVYLRISSNRAVAPLNLFDWLINGSKTLADPSHLAQADLHMQVALGSTLAGIVNGTSLVRGLISLATLMGFQMITSLLSATSHSLERYLSGPPLVIAFRGKPLNNVMRKHRISQGDLNLALRGAGVWNICEIEVVIIEPTGTFSIYKRKDVPDDYEAEVLLDVPGYQKLCEHFDQKSTDSDDQNKKGSRAGSPDSSQAAGGRSKKKSPGGEGDDEDTANDIAAEEA